MDRIFHGHKFFKDKDSLTSKRATANILAGIAFIFCSIVAVQAQKLDVVIVDRMSSETNYSYQIPGRLFARLRECGLCWYGKFGQLFWFCNYHRLCYYSSHGFLRCSWSDFALKLPDGRLVIVNCVSKYAPRGDYVNRRSCRVPLIDEIKAEFDGDKAKLLWPVSIDGKKTQSETYKILGIFPKQ